jgi:hypothetical protein
MGLTLHLDGSRSCIYRPRTLPERPSPSIVCPLCSRVLTTASRHIVPGSHPKLPYPSLSLSRVTAYSHCHTRATEHEASLSGIRPFRPDVRRPSAKPEATN